MKQTIVRTIGVGNAITALLVCGEAMAATTETSRVELQVDTEKVVQTNFLGVNGTYHGFAFMPEQVNKGMNDADRAREFDRVSRMGLKIARTWYRPDWACGASLTNAWDWDSTKMKALYAWLQAMKEHKVDVALQAGWWFPHDTYHGFPGANASEDPSRYARWVSESVHQLVTVRGFSNVKYLILFTEPTTSSHGKLPEGVPMWEYYAKTIKAIHGQLVADGRRGLVKMVGPNNTRRGQDLAQAARDLNAELDILSGHDYNLAGYRDWFNMCQQMQAVATKAGKEFWLDEWGRQDERYRQTADYGTYAAEVVAASMNAGNQSSFIWLLFDQQYVSAFETNNVNTWSNGDSFCNGVHRWGTCKWPRDNIANPTYAYPHWYSFSMLSRLLGGGDGTRVMATKSAGGVYVAAIRSPKDDWSILVVNANRQSSEVVVNFTSPLKRTLSRYLYDPAKIVTDEQANLIKSMGEVVVDQSQLTDTLPPRGVAIYSTITDASVAE